LYVLYIIAAQPALLYLVPACLLASTMVGLIKKEYMSVLLVYAEEDDKKKNEESKETAVEAKKDN
jgi:Signal peptide peptidase